MSQIRAVVSWKQKPESDIILRFVLHYTPRLVSFDHVADVTVFVFLSGIFRTSGNDASVMTAEEGECAEASGILAFRFSLKLMTLNVKGNSCNMSHDSSD